MPHPLLAELDPDQQHLITILGRPWMVNDLSDAKGWPVWDFVRRRFSINRPDAPPARDVLASLPVMTSNAFYGGSYGLWWRAAPKAPELGVDERVGLTIVGLHHLRLIEEPNETDQRPDLAYVCFDILRTAAERERDLRENANWTVPASGTFDIRADQFRGVSSVEPPVEILGQVLLHEFVPLARATTRFNYEVSFGPGHLERFLDARSVKDYLSVIDALAAAEEDVVLPASPLGLPATLDYLGLLLARHPNWQASGPLLDLPDFDAAASVVQAPHSRTEFNQRCSDLWNIISRLRVPPGSDDDYERERWDPTRKGSVNNLVIWLMNHLGPEYENSCADAIRTLRAIGHVRQGSQHAGNATRTRQQEALLRLGLPALITDWAGAWDAVQRHAAAAVYAIALSVR